MGFRNTVIELINIYIAINRDIKSRMKRCLCLLLMIMRQSSR